MPQFHAVKNYWDEISANWRPITPGNQPYLIPYHEDFCQPSHYGTFAGGAYGSSNRVERHRSMTSQTNSRITELDSTTPQSPLARPPSPQHIYTDHFSGHRKHSIDHSGSDTSLHKDKRRCINTTTPPKYRVKHTSRTSRRSKMSRKSRASSMSSNDSAHHVRKLLESTAAFWASRAANASNVASAASSSPPPDTRLSSSSSSSNAPSEHAAVDTDAKTITDIDTIHPADSPSMTPHLPTSSPQTVIHHTLSNPLPSSTWHLDPERRPLLPQLSPQVSPLVTMYGSSYPNQDSPRTEAFPALGSETYDAGSDSESGRSWTTGGTGRRRWDLGGGRSRGRDWDAWTVAYFGAVFLVGVGGGGVLLVWALVHQEGWYLGGRG